jgi:hypothetical protein
MEKPFCTMLMVSSILMGVAKTQFIPQPHLSDPVEELYGGITDCMIETAALDSLVGIYFEGSWGLVVSLKLDYIASCYMKII